ncbi:hypothetical protein HER10_EVM0005080 [Colletotrichum scovillei]|uniref:uncharacterized protein n=1 Tax=Colletotrichum scovillei TaxID=1209932 RepID=UPI0015C37C86|nr:uncharacterized protein HER10_EVM0005080 [Colletotrichum scovillei]KAF4781916.1 hypothetical protein HER10_EVM0005080 [Colletotrichum scovillei]
MHFRRHAGSQRREIGEAAWSLSRWRQGRGQWGLVGWRTVSNARTFGYNVFFNSLMYRTRPLESMKWPKQRSKEGNMFLSTQLHDSLHPLSMHACTYPTSKLEEEL